MNLHRKFLTTITVILLFPATALLIPAQTETNRPNPTIDAAARTKIIEVVIKRFNDSYIFPEVAKAMEQSVRERMRKGEYDKITDPKVLAETLKANLREVSKDTHIDVVFSNKPLPPLDEVEREETAEELEKRRRDYAYINNGFVKFERLRGNVGLLDIDLFVDPTLAGDTANAAMNFLANTDALIVDLRYSPGGNGQMVALLATYFFAESVHLNDYYQRNINFTKQTWTLPYVPGQRFLNKDIYILISNRTHSAAEAFAYSLQSLKRATIVGEISRGGAHTIQRFRIDAHFGVQVPVGRSINPITKTNWEGKGVIPDVQTPADKALKVAHLKALKRLLGKNPNGERANEFKQLIESIEKEETAPK